MESTAARDSPPRRWARIFFWFNVTVWSSCVAVATWKMVPWQGTSALMLCLFLWGLVRLVAEIAIYRVDGFSAVTTDRNEVIAGWLFFARPAANGALFASWGALLLARSWWQPFVSIVGVVLLALGLASLTIGIRLLRGWRQARDGAMNTG